MAKKLDPKNLKYNLLSHVLIGITLLLVSIAAIEAVTQNDVTTLAPTQLFLIAGIFGILGLYVKED